MGIISQLSPQGAAETVAKKVGQALGIGPGPWHDSRNFKELLKVVNLARQGNFNAHYPIYLFTIKGELPNSHHGQVRSRARNVMTELGYGGWNPHSEIPGIIPERGQAQWNATNHTWDVPGSY